MRVLVRRLSGLVAAAAACAGLIFSAPAWAVVTLETNVSNITCGITTAAGETLPSRCDTLSFAAIIPPGQSAFLRGTLNYHYTDDGLPLPPLPPWAIQFDANGGVMIPVHNEAAVIYFLTNNCAESRYCRPTPGVEIVSTSFSPPLILGLNDQPDDITGSKDLFVNVAWTQADSPFNLTPTLFVDFRTQLFSAPVPEPGTFALMAAGLAALGLMGRRRRAA